MNRRLLLTSLVLSLLALGFIYFLDSDSMGIDVAKLSTPLSWEAKESKAPTSESAQSSEKNNDTSPAGHSPLDPANETVTGLTYGNFESFVAKCLQGENCKFAEDPLHMYREFKSAGNERALDNMISFMRSQLKDPAFRERYQDILLDIIYDFYPQEERQFQEAAYYDYLGDKKRSLDLYLDLQKKAKLDSTLKNAPNLNIANVLYDLKRYQEALPYYQAALNDYLSGQVRADPSPVGFIEARISEITRK